MTESSELYQNLAPRSLQPETQVQEALKAIDPENKMPPWQREIAGMYVSIGFVDRKARDPSKPGLTAHDIFAINKAVVNDPFNPHLYGVLRRAPIYEVVSTVKGERRVSVIDYPDPSELPEVFFDFARDMENRTRALNGSTSVNEMLELAAWAHDMVVRMHPFRDGNGRTARFLVDFIFKRCGASYLTDWGAKNDEYKDVVDRRFRENKPDLFKGFLGTKLIKRSEELGRKGQGLGEVTERIRSETVHYMQGLRLNGASFS